MKKVVSIILTTMITISLGITKVSADGNKAKIGQTEYLTLADAITNAEENDVVEIMVEGTYILPSITKYITIKSNVENVVIDAVGSGSIASIPNGTTFENLIFNFGDSAYHGFQHAGHIIFNSCELNGLFFSYSDMDFNDCTFNQTKVEYCMWNYAGNQTYTNCVFNGKGKFLNVYNEGNSNTDPSTGKKIPWEVTFEKCTFNSDTVNKSAINIKESCGSKPLQYHVYIDSDTTTNENFPTDKVGGSKVFMIDDLITNPDKDIIVYLDNVQVYPEPPKPVAAINDTKYLTLQDAFDAIETSGSVTLLEDIAPEYNTYYARVTKGKTITLDLNGKTIDGKSTQNGYTGLIDVENGGKLIIVDDTNLGKLLYTDTKDNNGGSTLHINGELDLYAGTIENKTNCVNSAIQAAIDIYANEWGIEYNPKELVFNMYGGTVKSNNSNTIRLTNFSSKANNTETSVKANIYNGKVIGGADAFFIQGVSNGVMGKNTLNIFGGSFDCKQSVRVFGNGFTTSCNKDALDEKPVQINITGGEFKDNSQKTYYKGITIQNYGQDSNIDLIKSYINVVIDGGIYNYFETIEDAVVTGKTVVANTNKSTGATYPYTIGIKTVVSDIDTKGKQEENDEPEEKVIPTTQEERKAIDDVKTAIANTNIDLKAEAITLANNNNVITNEIIQKAKSEEILQELNIEANEIEEKLEINVNVTLKQDITEVKMNDSVIDKLDSFKVDITPIYTIVATNKDDSSKSVELSTTQQKFAVTRTVKIKFYLPEGFVTEGNYETSNIYIKHLGNVYGDENDTLNGEIFAKKDDNGFYVEFLNPDGFSEFEFSLNELLPDSKPETSPKPRKYSAPVTGIR